MTGSLVAALFLLMGLPALLLAWRNTKLRLALALAIAFPSVFVILFVGATIVYA